MNLIIITIEGKLQKKEINLPYPVFAISILYVKNSLLISTKKTHSLCKINNFSYQQIIEKSVKTHAIKKN